MKKLKTEDLIEIVDYWFKKTYGKSVMELSEEERMSKDFYSKYPVTQELHDEWNDWAIEYCRKKLKCSKRYVERGFWSLYLNLSPSVK